MNEGTHGNMASFPVLQFEPDEGRVLLRDGRTARIRLVDVLPGATVGSLRDNAPDHRTLPHGDRKRIG